MLALASSTAYLAVGVLALTGTVVAGYFANRTRKQIAKVELSQTATSTAITGLDHLASQLQTRVVEVEDQLTEAKLERAEDRKEIKSLKAENIDVKLRLDECKRSELALSLRVAELEAQ